MDNLAYSELYRIDNMAARKGASGSQSWNKYNNYFK